jgi:hypothetical protein
MKKVILTKEQAEFAKKFTEGFKERFPELHLDNFSYALLHGYEVEPEFCVDDLAVIEYDEIQKPRKILSVMFLNGEKYAYLENWDEVPFSKLRKATEEEVEQRFWAKHGREPWELKNGDVLRNTKDVYIVLAEIGDEIHTYSLNKNSETIKKDLIKENFRVVVFHHDRLDLEEFRPDVKTNG